MTKYGLIELLRYIVQNLYWPGPEGVKVRLLEILDLLGEDFEWCHDCKECDHEHHCCPRFGSAIAETLKDMKGDSNG